MSLHDLTPHLRTRLNRAEWVLTAFVGLAVLLFLAAFAYYVYRTADRKGWFINHVTYYTYLRSGEGIQIGDPVKLMGFDIGEVSDIKGNNPDDYFSVTNRWYVYVEMKVRQPNYGYIWSDSTAKVTGDFLGARRIEITRGWNGKPTAQPHEEGVLVRSWHWDEKGKFYFGSSRDGRSLLLPDESANLSDSINEVVSRVQKELPNVLRLTNDVKIAVQRSAELVEQSTELVKAANALAQATKPVMTNLTVITGFLTNSDGSLGKWAMPSDLRRETVAALQEANRAMLEITPALKNVEKMTENINRQIEKNPTLLSDISSIVVNTDDMVDGLKHHWFLRGAFKNREQLKADKEKLREVQRAARDQDPRSKRRGTVRVTGSKPDASE